MQALGVARGGRDDHAPPGNVREERVVVAGVVGRGRAADADRAPQDDRHLQPAAAHVLHLGGLVDHLAEGVEDEIEEHEVDHRPGAGHRGAGAHADEAALDDRGVAQALRPVLLVAGRG